MTGSTGIAALALCEAQSGWGGRSAVAAAEGPVWPTEGMQPAEAVSPLSHLPSVFKHLVPVSVVYLVVFYTRFLTLPPIHGEKKKKKTGLA